MAAHAGDCIAVLVAAIKAANNFDQRSFRQSTPPPSKAVSLAIRAFACVRNVIPELRAASAIWADGVVAPSLDRAARMLDTQPRFYRHLSHENQTLRRRC